MFSYLIPKLTLCQWSPGQVKGTSYEFTYWAIFKNSLHSY